MARGCRSTTCTQQKFCTAGSKRRAQVWRAWACLECAAERADACRVCEQLCEQTQPAMHPSSAFQLQSDLTSMPQLSPPGSPTAAAPSSWSRGGCRGLPRRRSRAGWASLKPHTPAGCPLLLALPIAWRWGNCMAHSNIECECLRVSMRGYFDAAGMHVDLGCRRQAKISHKSSGQHMNAALGFLPRPHVR